MICKNVKRATVFGAFLLVFVAASPLAAQQSDERRKEIAERIQERFTSLLRSELALSDEQAEVVLPQMEELERMKTEMGRERRETSRALRRGMEGGASDAELQELLDRLERNEEGLRVAERSALAKIDAELNTRQRVKLRFFVQQFRSQIRERLSRRVDRDVRRDRMNRPPRPDGR